MATERAGKGARAVIRDIRARRPAVHSHLLAGSLRRAISAITLVVLDICGLALAMYAALLLQRIYRDLPLLPGVVWRDGLVEFLPFCALVTVGVFAWRGLYRARESRPGGLAVAGSLAIATLVIVLFALATGETFRTYAIFPTTWLLGTILIIALRASYDSVATAVFRAAGITRRTLVAGRADALGNMRAAVHAARRGPDVTILGAATVDGAASTLPGVQTLGTLDDLPRLVDELQPDDVLVSGVELRDDDVLRLVEACRAVQARLYLVPTTTELLVRRLTYVSGETVPLFEVRPPVIEGVDWYVKRTFDMVVSVLMLVLLSPLLLTIALAVRLSGPGGVIYRDRRIGVGDREFDMLKFRSMQADAADRQAEVEHLNEAGGAIFKIRDDPRVTGIGKLIRRLSFDELPQLINVLRGEMSLVGPRPLPLRDAALLSDWHGARHRVLPGITGLWQTSGRSDLSFDDLVRLDFYYIENWSLWMDVSILIRTPLVVVFGKGAY